MENRDFLKSHDIYGNRSIVAVPSFGHTPGSVIIFVALRNGTRYAFVGDLVWQLEGIMQREERSWAIRRSADLEVKGTHENLLHMIAIQESMP